MAIVVIRYETKTAARRALTFIVRIFVNDTIAITVWTSFYFHACSCLHAGCRAQQVMVDVRYWALRGRSRGAPQSQFLTDAVDKVSDA
jgi:hypothetical protein